jgi:2-polyprenyl-6-methoxyphenol hydroxylase-like FAD-dependent oxidoreductase
MNKNILISGASIAGHALAYWLRQYGFNPTLVEVASAPREGGYAVDFRGQEHIAILERMGILDKVRQASTNMGGMSFVDKNNKRLASLPSDLVTGDIEILRNDLVRILHDISQPEIEFMFDDSISSIKHNDAEVHVTFKRGKTRTFDLLVGADGLHSNVRALAFGDESRFSHYLGYHIAFFTTDNHLNLDYEGVFYNTPGKVAGMYSARRNTEAKSVFIFQSPALDFDFRDREQQQRIISDTYANEEWEIPRLLESMKKSTDFYFDSITQIHMNQWSDGRIALLGDAAYCASPLSGLGTGLAMVGAYILAGELAAAKGDYRVAFTRYEEQMRDYAAQCQKHAEGVGEWFVPMNMEDILTRNQDLQNAATANNENPDSEIANSSRQAARSITIKDYNS